MTATPVKSLTPGAASSSQSLPTQMASDCPLGDTALGFEDWAYIRQSFNPFLAKAGEDSLLKTKMQEIAEAAKILKAQGLVAVRDILGLLEGNLDTLKGLVTVANSTLAVMNTFGLLLQEVRRAITEKETRDQAALATAASSSVSIPTAPEVSSADIQAIFQQNGVPLPEQDLMASATLYARMLKDNKASPNGTGFSEVDLRKDCLPLSWRSRGSDLPESADVLEQLRVALDTNSTANRKTSKFFAKSEEWARHFLVYAYAAAGTGQMDLHASLSHMNHVLGICYTHDFVTAMTYDSRIRAKAASTFFREGKVPTEIFSKKDEAELAGIINVNQMRQFWREGNKGKGNGGGGKNNRKRKDEDAFHNSSKKSKADQDADDDFTEKPKGKGRRGGGKGRGKGGGRQ